MRDPYVSLAVPRSATADDIKKSFRELAKRLHPDANNNAPKATALFAELNAAHEILGDVEKRRAFDKGEIDAEGKPTHRVIAPAKRRTWHVVTRLMVVMVMLAATSTLIVRGVTRAEKSNANSGSGDRVWSRVGANEEHAPASQPEQPVSGVQSEPRLILRQGVSYAGADGVALGIQVGGELDGLALEISGLPTGTTISSGRQLGDGRWRILATDAGNEMIQPAVGFSGTIDLTIELRLIDGAVVDNGLTRLEWLPRPTRVPDPTEYAGAMAALESSADKTLATTAPTDQKDIHHAAESQLDHEQIELLIGRSEKLLSEGDVGAARNPLQRAAEARDARAALALGATYDPIMLAILRARGVAADVYLARYWYEKAGEFGSREAPERLNLLASAKVDGGESVAVGTMEFLPKVEPGIATRDVQSPRRSRNHTPGGNICVVCSVKHGRKT